MLLLGVKVVIATDGADLYSTTLALEYEYAKKNLDKFHNKIDAESKDEIKLPNKDTLKYKDLISIANDEYKDEIKNNMEKDVTYKDLKKFVRGDVLKQNSIETLKENSKKLKESLESTIKSK